MKLALVLLMSAVGFGQATATSKAGESAKKHPGCEVWWHVDKNHETAVEKLQQAEAINETPCGCRVNGELFGVKDAYECRRLKKRCEKGCSFWGSGDKEPFDKGGK